MTQRDAIPGEPRRRPAWHLIYFALAAFDLATVCAGLYLNHRLMAIYTSSVAVNQRWADAQAVRAEVEEAAQAVNAPGNDVFDSHDAAGERGRRDRALDRFKKDLERLHGRVAVEASPGEQAGLLPALDAVSRAMDEMLAEADLIFDLFEAGDHVAAGGHMASMDRKYATLNDELRAVGAAIRDVQATNFRLQIEHANELRHYEYGIGGLIVVMVLLVTVYGHRMAHAMRAHEVERDQSLRAMQTSEDRFRNLVANVPGAVLQQQQGAGGDLTVTYASEGLRELWGLAPEDVQANPKTFLDAVHPEDRRAVRRRMAHSLANGSAREHEFRIMTKAGEEKWVRAIVRPRQSPDGVLLWDGLMLDVTKSIRQAEENRALEARLRQAQKLEALGTLSGGIAHEFNNMLTPIMGLTELSMSLVPDASPAHGHLKTVLASAERASQLIDKILTFSRPKDAAMVVIDLHAIVAEAVELVRVTKSPAITMHAVLDPMVGKIRADEIEIQQIVLNLASNARHAIASKVGTLSIELQRVVFASTVTGDRFSLPAGAYGKLSVSDTGHGMDRATAARIFEPFFTTKRVGDGTGLGLSVIHGIVTNLGGAIDVASTPGVGSRFDVYFPLQEDMAVPREGARPAADGWAERVA
jgi:PAS domain S-box-containing protein